MSRPAGIISIRGRGMPRAARAIGLTLLLAVVLTVALGGGRAQAADTGWRSPSANISSGWTNPQNAYASDDVRAEATSLDDIVDYQGFSLGIPSGSSIQGIQVSVEGLREANNWLDWGATRQVDISLSWNNGTNYTSGAGLKTSSFGTSESTQTFGSSSDLWGRPSWTAEELSNASFRVRLDCTATTYTYWIRIDHVQVRVYYTLPTTTTGLAADLGSPITYGDNITFTATVTGSAGSNTPSGTVTFMDGATTLGTGTLSTTGNPREATATFWTTTLAAGTHGSITATYAGDGNFSGSSSSAISRTVNTKSLTITADNRSKAYGDTVAFAGTEFAASGLVNSDTVTGVILTSDGTAASATVAGNPYAITPSAAAGSGLSNYTITYTDGSLTVGPRDLTVTAAGIDRVYDGTAAATVTLGTDALGGDNVTASFTGASFDNKNVGIGKTVTVSGISISGADAANYNLLNTTASTTADIAPRDLTVTATGIGKVYDGTAAATVTLATDALGGDNVTANFTGASFDDKNVGIGKTVSVSGISISGADAANYNLLNTTAATAADITRRDLTVTAAGIDRVYDGTATATVTLGTDALGGDNVTASYTGASFDNKNVGIGKTVSVSGISIDGADAANYNLLNTTAATAADITRRDLTVTAAGIDRVYDGTADAAVTLDTDAPGGDNVTANFAAASFADRNAGSGKTVTVSGISISGADAANYNLLNATASTTASITPKALTITALPNTRTYDGTTAAAAIPVASGLEGSDTATGLAEAYDSRNAGTGKTLRVTAYTVNDGNSGNNYTVTLVEDTTGVITPRDLTVTATGIDRVYDGTATATVTLGTDALDGDNVTASYTGASFDDRNVGTDIPVSISGISISGADAANYNLLNTTASTAASITPRDLTVTAIGIDRVYDGTAAATGTLDTDALGGDNVTPSYTGASFDNKNVGIGKTVSISGISISGADAANYNLLNTTASTTANITPRDLTVTATGVDRVYDGTAAATVTLATDALGGDNVTASYTGASFADRNVGIGKTVSVSGISISGADAANYNLLNTTASTVASITPRDLTVTATGIDRVYDGTAAATVTLGADAVGGDNVTASYTGASFADRNVGTDIPVSVSGISISGADAANYNLLNTTAATAADITPRDLTVTAAGIDKVYDGTADATVTLGTDAPGGDNVTPSYTAASFADKNVGIGKTVSVSGISIGGAGAANYNLLNTTASTAASITPRELTVTAAGIDRVYDSTAAAAVTLGTDALGGDNVTASYTAASFDDRNVGTDIPVSVSGISIGGAGAANYNLLNTTAATVADITRRDLTVTAAGIDKVYDGTADATVTLGTDAPGGDNVTPSYTGASFDNKNVGISKTVSVSGISISGADAANYNLLNTTASTAADITPRELTVTAAGIDRVYDSTAAAAVTLGTDALGGDNVTASYTAASFADKNVGIGKTVSVSGISISGAGAANYSLLNATASTTADITPRDLTVTAAGIDKVYDGTAAATVTLGTDAPGGDNVTANYATASFDDMNVGTDIPVSVSGISISGADAANYNLLNTTASTTADITPLPVTVTAHARIKVHGDPDPALTYDYAPALIGSDAFSGALTRDPGEDIGTYAITRGTLTAGPNYDITCVGATLTIGPPVLTITTSSPLPGATVGVPYSQTLTASGGTAPCSWSIVSGALPDGLSLNPATGEISGTPAAAGGPVTITFMVTDSVSDSDTAGISITVARGTPSVTWANPDDIVYGTTLGATQLNATASVPGTFVYTPADGTLLSAGRGQTLHVEFTPLDTANYHPASRDATINVAPLAITVAADAQGKTYGDPDPALTCSCAPSLVGSDAFSGALSRDPGEDAGTYAITRGTLTAGPNYEITYTGADLTIAPLAITVTANAQGKTYGDPDPALTYSFTPALIGSDAFSGALARDPGDDAGTYAITRGTLTAGPNYEITFAGADLAVGPRALTVTARDLGKAFGEALTFTGTEFTAAGLAFSDSVSSVDLSSTGADASAAIGDYDILASDASGTGLGNYTITYVKGTLAVRTGLTITADSSGKTYGETITFAGTEFAVIGLQGSDSVTSVTLTSSGAEVSATVGTYGIVPGNAAGTGLENYHITYEEGTLTVAPRPLTITADSSGKTYGETITFAGTEFAVIGLQGSDSVTSVTLTSSGAGVSATVGTYGIVPGNAAGTGLENYHITYEEGTLTVAPRPLTITAKDRAKTYGEAVTFAGTEFAAAGLVNSDTVTGVSLSCAGAGAVSPVGTYDIVPGAAAGTGLANYTISYVRRTLTVAPSPLTITAKDRGKTYGEAVTFAGTEFAAAGLVNSDTVTGVSLSCAGAGAVSPAGTYDIIPGAAAGTGLANYTISYVSGTLTVGRSGAGIWTVTCSPARSAEGSPVTITATVSNAEATGMVTFMDGGTVLGTAVLSNGVATFTTSALSAGSHYFTVHHDGDANFDGGSSLAHIHIVTDRAGLNWWWVIIAGAAAGGFLLFLLVLRRRRKRGGQGEAAA